MLKGIKTAFCSLYEKLNEKRIPCIAFLTAVVMIITTLISYSIRTYVIFDGESTYKVNSFFAGLENKLNSAGLKSNNYKIVKVNAGKINIAYTYPVYVTIGDKTETVEVTGNTTVESILKNAGYTVDSYDMVEPALDTVVKNTIYIDYTNIDYITDSYTETIPAKTITVYSSDYKNGTQKIEQGSDGVQQINCTHKVVNGQTVETIIDSSEVVTAPVNTKKIVGTKTTSVKTSVAVTTSASVKTISTLVPPSSIELDMNGVPTNYKKHITVQATAYTYTGHNCATGVAPQPGYIAVNPNVIPYGTKMYIKSSDGKFIYGYAVAADTGGFTKKYPNNVDLFFSSRGECSAFGRRNVTIYFL